MNVETFRYDNKIIRAFAIATVIWAIVGIGSERGGEPIDHNHRHRGG